MSLDYETVPYRGYPISATAPARMALAALAQGGPVASLEAPRVLEIGCGDGANLLPLAYFHPRWQLRGVDSSARAIATAREGARALGIDNVSFADADLASFEPEGEHDFVIAHGVYSWIDADRRAALRRLARRALAPSGLSYVSFNAMPGWGVRGRIRDLLLRSTERPTLEAARARVEDLAGLVPEEQNDWTMLLSHELERARAAADAYLAHEYLAPDNHAFWLGEVTRDFASDGLRYVGDGFFGAPEGFVDPALRARAEGTGGDAIAQEEMIDLILFRQLRAALFCREDAPAPAAVDVLEHAWVACAARRRSDPFDLTVDAEEVFDSPYGREIRVRAPLSKMALLVLADRYPEAFRVHTLVAECRERLASHGIAPEAGDEARMREGLSTLAALLDVELRLDAPPLRIEPRARPRALALTRHEAERSETVTSALHTMIPLDPLDRAIVVRLDGSRSVSQVADAIADAQASGELELEGAPSGGPHLRAFAEERAERTITLLGWWGLLEA
jgi:SAM-dependent methyltransferase